MNYPVVHCLHPKKIRNPYTGDTLVVPCGKCEACSNRKSYINATKCRLESQVHRYCYFVTLTYNNKNIPRAELIPDADGYQLLVSKDVRTGTSGEILCQVNTEEKHLYYIRKKVNLNGDIPFLCAYDVQLFLKRLRKLIKNEKIRVYYSGEYGPVHFRPHYHLLLWFEESWTAANIQLLVRKAWSFGRVDTERAKDAAQYVAGYLNSACNLPKIYKTGKARPFSNHSFYLGEKFLSLSKEEVFKMSPADFVKRSVCINGRIANINLWRSLIASSYPKCRSYGTLSTTERYFSYTAYERVKKEYGITSCYQLAVYLVDEITIRTPFDGSKEYANVVSDKRRMIHRWLTKYCNIDRFKCDVDSMQRYYRAVYNVLAVSRQFLLIADTYFKADYMKYLYKIELFYKDLDYMHLTDFLSQLEESSPAMCSTDFLFCYNNTLFDVDELLDSPMYLTYSSEVLQNYERSIKHKKLNDLNNIFNNI